MSTNPRPTPRSTPSRKPTSARCSVRWAREHEPIPDDVSARLDDTLAMLRTERVQSGEPADVVPLRRRWLPRAAGAAAAVIVLGVGGVAAVRLGTDSSSQDSAASRGVASDDDPVVPGTLRRPGALRRCRGDTRLEVACPARVRRRASGRCRRSPRPPSHADVAGLLRTDTSVVTPDERSADQSGAESGSTSGGRPRPPSSPRPMPCSPGRARARRSPTVPWPTRCASTGRWPCCSSIPRRTASSWSRPGPATATDGWTAPS